MFAETVWLSSLDLKEMTTGWSVAKADHEIAGGPLSIHGERFARRRDARDQQIPGETRRQCEALHRRSRRGRQRGQSRQRGIHCQRRWKILWHSGVLKGGEAAKPVM